MREDREGAADFFCSRDRSLTEGSSWQEGGSGEKVFAERTDDGTEQPTPEASLVPERPSASPGPGTVAWRVFGKLHNIL